MMPGRLHWQWPQLYWMKNHDRVCIQQVFIHHKNREVIIIDKSDCVNPASFRDPSGHIYEQEGVLYRRVNQVYRDNYDLLMKSGLYNELTHQGFLVRHEEVEEEAPQQGNAYKVLRPEKIDFISYPYEWSFSQLRDAARLTLAIQLLAMEHEMSLKDASAYNIQFDHGRPVMIDTLSFEKYIEGRPWVAYRQFCQHFLAPLALMSRKDVRLNKLLLGYIDGIPLDLAGSLLPGSSWLNIGLALHLHIHAKTQKAYSKSPDAGKAGQRKNRPISKNGLTGIVQGLDKTIRKMKCQLSGTEWGEYYQSTNYSDSAFKDKQDAVKEYLEMARPARVWDLGANTGVFSRLASEMGIFTVSFDIDPAAVDYNYRQIRDQREKNLLPLVFDLTNPSPGLGWDCRERDSLMRRGPVDCILALALIHHLAISNNVPLEKLASFFAGLCTSLIIEFVPKEDSQVQRLLASREDVFSDYNQQHFEIVFSKYFKVNQVKKIRDSTRTLFLMHKI